MPEARRALRSPGAAGVAGVIFALLMGAAFVLIRLSTQIGSEVVDSSWLVDEGRRRNVSLAVNLLPFAGIAFLWFIGVVRDHIGTGEDRLFATVFLGSGVLFVAMLFASGAVAGGLLLGNQDPEVWAFGREITQNLLMIYAMRMAAVFTLSTSTMLTRLAIVPRWLSVCGFLTALTLLAAAGWINWVELVFPLWVLVLSAYILYATNTRPGSIP